MMTTPVDISTQAMDVIRGYCGWHLTPVVTETLRLDGPGGRVLILPTGRLGSITEIVEDGSVLDPERYRWSTTGRVEKIWANFLPEYGGPVHPSRHRVDTLTGTLASGSVWTTNLGGITATIVHGYSDDDPAVTGDIAAAIDIVDRWLEARSEREPGMITRRVNEVTYQWDPGWSQQFPAAGLLTKYRLRFP